MTNPIAKVIAKVGVAMGYGQLEDYKGSSVEDMLEIFAEKAYSAKDLNVHVRLDSGSVSQFVSDKSSSEITDALRKDRNVIIHVAIPELDGEGVSYGVSNVVFKAANATYVLASVIILDDDINAIISVKIDGNTATLLHRSFKIDEVG